MKFYTADCHFYHKNIIRYEDRPFTGVEDMNNYLMWKWNQKVGKGDEVYIMGDFAFCSGRQANELLDQLNGRKFLIKGNHDSFLQDRDFDRSKFVWIKDYAKIYDGNEKVILFHYPIAVWDCKHHGSIHLFGHIHSDKEDHHPLVVKLDGAYNVGVDVRDNAPVTLQEILGK